MKDVLEDAFVEELGDRISSSWTPPVPASIPMWLKVILTAPLRSALSM